ncbi:MAG TPA: bifunctional 4-hydroxy-2-oxoglutarate aldolase/2-dehydro-3-deoxy-phosphogluconate aldolase [Longimicrobium sp.]|nr:bifunctional 4-hydroxy-2-oxoglutarate aldolase/2-dehydro-3-deoxy-phosphogluconate aldolase [Longimicrobium sp.]
MMDTTSTATRADVMRRLTELGAIAVVRLGDAESAVRAAEAVHAGGMHAIEVTLTTPGALEVIRRLSTVDGMIVGAGSVLDAESARNAIHAGARYIVSPVFLPELVDTGHAAEVAVLLGAFTPTEILRAHRAGADAVKVFPSDALGPAFIRGVLGPMPFLRLVPTGGVTPENVGDWLRAGAVAVGLGGALVDAKRVAAGDFATLTERARQVVASVAAARGGAA